MFYLKIIIMKIMYFKQRLNALIKINILLTIVLLTFFSDILRAQRITVDGNTFKVYGKEIFMNGVNTPWDNWNDFGGNYDHDFWNTEFQEDQAGWR